MAGANYTPSSISESGAKPTGPSGPEYKAPTPTPVAAQPWMDATYTQNVAARNLQLQTTLASDQETFENEQKAFKYQNILREEREPELYGRLRAQGVARGGFESGIQGELRGREAAKFGIEKARALENLTSGVNRLERTAQEGVQGFEGYQAQQGGLAEQRYKAKTIKEEPKTPEQPAAGPHPGAEAYLKSINITPQQQVLFSKLSPAEKARFEREPFPLVANPGGVAQRAKGGPVNKAGPVEVGERGPELLYLPKGSYVQPRRRAVEKAVKR